MAIWSGPQTNVREAAVIGSRVLSPDLTLQSVGGILWRDASTSTAWVGAAPARDAFAQCRQVDYCGTASLLVRADFWDEIGGFDERFYPAYYVDVDFCMTAHKHRRAVLYEPRSEILHRRESSTTLAFRDLIVPRNRDLFASKWGEELERQDMFQPDDPSGSHTRALERAAQRSVSLVTPVRASGKSTLDIAAQQRRHGAQARALREAYEAHLLRRLAVQARARPPIPPYVLGTELSFTEGGDGHRYSIEGEGHRPESWGTWMSTSRVRLILPFSDAGRPTGLGGEMERTLRLVVNHLLGQGRPASSLTLSVNGRCLLRSCATLGGPQGYDVPLPVDLLMDANCLIVEIDAADCTTPRALGINADTRPISIGLISLCVDIGGTPSARSTMDTHILNDG